MITFRSKNRNIARIEAEQGTPAALRALGLDILAKTLEDQRRYKDFVVAVEGIKNIKDRPKETQEKLAFAQRIESIAMEVLYNATL